MVHCDERLAFGTAVGGMEKFSVIFVMEIKNARKSVGFTT